VQKDNSSEKNADEEEGGEGKEGGNDVKAEAEAVDEEKESTKSKAKPVSIPTNSNVQATQLNS